MNVDSHALSSRLLQTHLGDSVADALLGHAQVLFDTGKHDEAEKARPCRAFFLETLLLRHLPCSAFHISTLCVTGKCF